MMLSVSGLALHAWWALRWDGLGVQTHSSQTAEVLPDSCSVVVCCHNEASRIAGFHQALQPALNHAEARGVQVNVVAVNHGSTDGTAEALDALKERAGWTVVHQARTRPSKKEALEAGMAAVKGQVVVVTDIDCTPLGPDWLTMMLSGAAAQWDVRVGLSLPGRGSGLLHVLQRLEAERSAQKAVGAVVRGRAYLGFGRNMAFTRDMWTRVGGMSNHAHVRSGDDDLWLQEAVALGARVSTNPSPAAQTASVWPSTLGRLAQAKNKACVRQLGVPHDHVGTAGPAHPGHGTVGRGGCPQSFGDIGPLRGVSAALAGRYFRVVLAPSRQTSPSGVDPPAGTRRGIVPQLVVVEGRNH